MAPTTDIDLGTTHSCVAVYQNEHVEVIENDLWNRTTPSVVAVDGTESVAGLMAKRNTKNAANTISEDRAVAEEQFQGQTRQFNPVEISAIILSKLKGFAEATFGEPVTEAVITVPAYFNNAQRQATKDKGGIAGLKVFQETSGVALSDDPEAIRRLIQAAKQAKKELSVRT